MTSTVVNDKLSAVMSLIDGLQTPEAIASVLGKQVAGLETRTQHVKKLLRIIQPQIVLEIGTRVGYTALELALELKSMGSQAHVHSFEANPEFWEVGKRVVKQSGLDNIHLHEGSPEELIASWDAERVSQRVNFIVLNRTSLNALRAIEALGLVNPGTVIIADYDLVMEAYVSSCPAWRKQYNVEHKHPNGDEFMGRWGITYDHKMENSLILIKCLSVLT